MPRLCTICAHPQRVEMESAVLGGKSIRSAAKAAGICWSALQRHLKHLPVAIARAAETEALQIEACGKLPARIEELIAQTRQILKSAKKKNDFAAALAAIRANLSCLEMLGKISGELGPRAEVIVATQVNTGEPGEPAVSKEEKRDRFLAKWAECYGITWPRKPRVM